MQKTGIFNDYAAIGLGWSAVQTAIGSRYLGQAGKHGFAKVAFVRLWSPATQQPRQPSRGRVDVLRNPLSQFHPFLSRRLQTGALFSKLLFQPL
jgi:hypothetical protein